MTKATPAIERLMSHIVKVPSVLPTDCWMSTFVPNRNGYTRVHEGKRGLWSHRLSYEYFVGPIPTGLQVDHLCHNEDAACAEGESCPHRRCVNPTHMELVTNRENMLRGHHPSAIAARNETCWKGHPMENVILRSSGVRQCRICKNAADRRSYAKRRKNAAAAHNP